MGTGYPTRRAIFLVPLVACWLTLPAATAPAMHAALIPVAASAASASDGADFLAEHAFRQIGGDG